MLRVIQPGLFATVQDLGRTGGRRFGEPVSGVFDRFAAATANALVGNDEAAAVIEMTAIGGHFRAEEPLALALAGAPMTARIDTPLGPTRLLKIPQSFHLRKAESLVLGHAPCGSRTYLAAQGGWLTLARLGSRSRETPLRSGDLLAASHSEGKSQHPAEMPDREDALAPIRYVDGPDVGRLRDRLDSRLYHVGPQSSRMGLLLEGDLLSIDIDPERLSSPVAPGAIQIAGGRPIVLGPACGTMGGYPHVAHVITADLGRVGQLRPGDPVRFQRVDIGEARRILHEADRSRSQFCRRLRTMARG